MLWSMTCCALPNCATAAHFTGSEKPVSQAHFLGKDRVGIQATWIPKPKPFPRYHASFRGGVQAKTC